MGVTEACRKLTEMETDGASAAACSHARALLQAVECVPDLWHVEDGRDNSVLLEWDDQRKGARLAVEVFADGAIGYTKATGARGTRVFESADGIDMGQLTDVFAARWFGG